MPTSGPPTDVESWAKWAEFETFNDPDLIGMVKAAMQWRIAVSKNAIPFWLSFVGHSGTGKSYLANRLWKSVSSRPDFNPVQIRYYPKWILWPDFVDKLKDGDHYEMFNDMKHWPYLVLDDIGAERDTSGFATEKLSTLLSCRCGQWTLLTSNLTLAALSKVDKRITSRMIRDGSIVCDVKTTDYSLRKSK